jgi:carbon-monoxide dehydrogenase medium subunit
VIPARFDYVRASSLGEAISVLSSGGEDAKVIAGGQSLLPLLRLRFAYPSVLVDLGGLGAELRGVRDVGDSLEIGALTTHYELTRDPLVLAHCGLLAEAAGMIADPAVRHRGTLGGALAHADPAGDLPAVISALDGVLLVHGPSGDRAISPGDFFTDYLSTSMGPGEILTAIRVPKLDGWGYRYEKFHVTAQAWAIVGVAAVARRANGHVAEARVGLTNMGSVPVRAFAVEAAAAGAEASPDALLAAAAHADDGTSPPSDLRGAADYRRHLARVLTGRALTAAAGVG